MGPGGGGGGGGGGADDEAVEPSTAGTPSGRTPSGTPSAASGSSKILTFLGERFW